MPRLRQTQSGPDRQNETAEQQRVEIPPPCAHLEQPLAQRGREHGNDDEHHHRERHHAGHLPTGVEVAHDGDGDDARRRRAQALHRARGEQNDEAGRQRRHQGSRDEHGDAQHQNRLAAVAVRKPPVGELAHGKAKDIADDDDLPIIGVGDPHSRGDGRKRRQHDVDGERGERHHQGDEGNELHVRQSMLRRRSRDRHGRVPMSRKLHGPYFLLLVWCRALQVAASGIWRQPPA